MFWNNVFLFVLIFLTLLTNPLYTEHFVIFFLLIVCHKTVDHHIFFQDQFYKLLHVYFTFHDFSLQACSLGGR